ncbi:MAG: hypothetical protein H7175_26320 [Burkholderiales bacterium]|nr:hypothetical protein [Anaerolineae bacterium]
MFKRIDQSPTLARLIERLSALLAKQRGLPVVIGILLVIVSFIIQLVEVYTESRLLELIGIITLNVGLLTALIGLLMAEPLGK